MIARAAITGCALALMTATAAQADWFRNSEQRAMEQFAAGDFDAAAAGFSDAFRRGVALYRGERFAEAEAAFTEAAQSSEPPTRARYNLGNARFEQGDLVGAIDAYEQVLNADPDHDDAHHNLALARGLLAKQEQQAFEQDKQEPAPDAESDSESETQQDEEGRSSQHSEPQEEQEGQEQDEPRGEEQQQAREQEGDQEGDQESGEEGDQEQQSEQAGDQEQEGQQGQAGEQQRQDGGQDQQPESGDGSSRGQESDSGMEQDAQRQQGQGDEQQQADAGGDTDAETESEGREQAGDKAGGATGDEQPEDTEGGDRETESSVAAGQQPRDDSDSETADGEQTRRDETGDGADAPRDDPERGQDAKQRDSGDEGGERPKQDTAGQAEPPDQQREPDQASAGGDEPEEIAGGDREPPSPNTEQDRGGDSGTPPSEQQRRSGGPPPPPDLQLEPSEADLRDAAAESEAIERFDQQGALPWSGLDPALGRSDTPALGGEQAMGPGMAIMEQRLEQIEGDPSLLMRNQFIIEEMRQLRESGGRLQESRPW